MHMVPSLAHIASLGLLVFWPTLMAYAGQAASDSSPGVGVRTIIQVLRSAETLAPTGLPLANVNALVDALPNSNVSFDRDALLIRSPEGTVLELRGLISAGQSDNPPLLAFADNSIISAAALLGLVNDFYMMSGRWRPIPVSAPYHRELDRKILNTLPTLYTFSRHFEPTRAGLHDLPTTHLEVPASDDMPYHFGWPERRRVFRVAYSAQDIGGTLQIRSHIPYLELIKAGRPVTWSDYETMSFEWVPPKLAVKVVNNRSTTVLATAAKIFVNTSTIDMTPIPVFYGGGWQKMSIINEGWGPLLNVVLQMGFASDEQCAENTPVTIETRRLEVDEIITNYSIGIIAQDLPDDLISKDIICALGQLDFSDVDGKRYHVPFRTYVVRDMTTGAGAPPSETYVIRLVAGKDKYGFEVPVSQSIKPGDADHFLFTVVADKSSAFDLTFELTDVSGEGLLKRNISLALFKPRYAPELDLDYSLYEPFSVKLEEFGSASVYIHRVSINPDDREKVAVFVTDAWSRLEFAGSLNVHEQVSSVLKAHGLKEGVCCYVDRNGLCVEAHGIF